MKTLRMIFDNKHDGMWHGQVGYALLCGNSFDEVASRLLAYAKQSYGIDATVNDIVVMNHFDIDFWHKMFNCEA